MKKIQNYNNPALNPHNEIHVSSMSGIVMQDTKNNTQQIQNIFHSNEMERYAVKQNDYNCFPNRQFKRIT